MKREIAATKRSTVTEAEAWFVVDETSALIMMLIGMFTAALTILLTLFQILVAVLSFIKANAVMVFFLGSAILIIGFLMMGSVENPNPEERI